MFDMIQDSGEKYYVWRDGRFRGKILCLTWCEIQGKIIMFDMMQDSGENYHVWHDARMFDMLQDSGKKYYVWHDARFRGKISFDMMQD